MAQGVRVDDAGFGCEPINKNECVFVDVNTIQTNIHQKGINSFCQLTSGTIIPADKKNLVVFVISIVTKRSMSEVTPEIIEDKFWPVKQHIIKCGLYKPWEKK